MSHTDIVLRMIGLFTVIVVCGIIIARTAIAIMDRIALHRARNKRVDIYLLLTERNSFGVVKEKCVKLTPDQVNDLVIIWKNGKRNADWYQSKQAHEMFSAWIDVKDFGLQIPIPIDADAERLLKDFQLLVRGEIPTIGIFNEETQECAILANSYESAKQRLARKH